MLLSLVAGISLRKQKSWSTDQKSCSRTRILATRSRILLSRSTELLSERRILLPGTSNRLHRPEFLRREALRVLARREILVRFQKIWSLEQDFSSANQKSALG